MALKLEPGTRLAVATHNPGKARELAEILENRFQLVSGEGLLEKVGCSGPQTAQDKIRIVAGEQR